MTTADSNLRALAKWFKRAGRVFWRGSASAEPTPAQAEKLRRMYEQFREVITLCARQLDMLMDSDHSPDFFARAFLAGEMHRF